MPSGQGPPLTFQERAYHVAYWGQIKKLSNQKTVAEYHAIIRIYLHVQRGDPQFDHKGLVIDDQTWGVYELVDLMLLLANLTNHLRTPSRLTISIYYPLVI